MNNYKLKIPVEMNLKKKKFLVILAILAVNISFSQKNNDHSVWLSAELNYKPNKNWVFGIEEQLRLKENASVTDSYFTEIGVAYLFDNGFALGTGYRFIKVNDTHGSRQGFDDYRRWHFDLSYRHKLSDFGLKFRLRYQNKHKLKAAPYKSKEYLRYKASIGYYDKERRLTPKLSVEIFNRIGENKISKNGLKKYRLTFGIAYSSKKSGKFGIFYRIEKHLNTKKPFKNYILGLKYSYTIKK